MIKFTGTFYTKTHSNIDISTTNREHKMIHYYYRLFQIFPQRIDYLLIHFFINGGMFRYDCYM